MRTRLDLLIQDSIHEFAEFYVHSTWLGKERDCVNIFALRFLASNVSEVSAIKELSQIRIEGGVPQPKKFPRASATKDIVIWKDPLTTAWDEDWNPVNTPRAIIEWKTSRTGATAPDYDPHDVDWMTSFTTEFPDTIGFLISTHSSQHSRSCKWTLVRNGVLAKTSEVVNND